MARYIINKAQFKPYSFDEYLKPYQLMTDEYNLRESAIADLQSNAESWEKLIGEQDGSPYTTYHGYINDLRQLSDTLGDLGLKGVSKKDIYKMASRYKNEITPIEVAYKKREQDIADFRKSDRGKSANYIGTRPEHIALEKYLYGNNPFIEGVTGEELSNKGFKIANTVSSRLVRYDHTPDGNYRIEKTGFNEQEAGAIIRSLITGTTTGNPTLDEVVINLKENALGPINTMYNRDSFTGADINKFDNSVLEGIYRGLLGSEKQTVDPYALALYEHRLKYPPGTPNPNDPNNLLGNLAIDDELATWVGQNSEVIEKLVGEDTSLSSLKLDKPITFEGKEFNDRISLSKWANDVYNRYWDFNPYGTKPSPAQKEMLEQYSNLKKSGLLLTSSELETLNKLNINSLDDLDKVFNSDLSSRRFDYPSYTIANKANASDLTEFIEGKITKAGSTGTTIFVLDRDKITTTDAEKDLSNFEVTGSSVSTLSLLEGTTPSIIVHGKIPKKKNKNEYESVSLLVPASKLNSSIKDAADIAKWQMASQGINSVNANTGSPEQQATAKKIIAELTGEIRGIINSGVPQVTTNAKSERR